MGHQHAKRNPIPPEKRHKPESDPKRRDTEYGPESGRTGIRHESDEFSDKKHRRKALKQPGQDSSCHDERIKDDVCDRLNSEDHPSEEEINAKVRKIEEEVEPEAKKAKPKRDISTNP